MRILKQSTAADILVFMADSADHITGKTGLTLTITLSKGAGAFNSISPTVTERASGWYDVTLTTAHTDTLGDGALHITATGADPTDTSFRVVARHLDDLAFPNTSGRGIDVDASGGVEITPNQNVNVNQWMTGTPNALVSGRVDASAGAIASGAITATAIATGAIDADSIAADAIQAAKIQSGAITAAKFASGAIDAAAIGTGAIDADAIASNAIADTKIASGAITAAKFASGAINSTVAPNLDATVSTRALETGGNLATVLSRIIGTLATGTHQPQSGDAYARVGAAGAGLTALGDTRIANLDAAVTSRAVAGDQMALTAVAIDAILDDTVEGSLTLRQIIRLLLAAAAGKVVVSGSVRSFRDQADTKNRISGTEDTDGQRTGVTVDGA